MPEKDPSMYAAGTYAWVFALALLGGVASYTQKVKAGISRFNLTELIGDLVTSGFVGLLTFYFCESSAIDGPLQAVFVGISGHMGSRAIFMLEQRLTRIFEPRG